MQGFGEKREYLLVWGPYNSMLKGMEWIHVAQNDEERHALLNTAMSRLML
jgi:hypothetical protein